MSSRKYITRYGNDKDIPTAEKCVKTIDSYEQSKTF